MRKVIILVARLRNSFCPARKVIQKEKTAILDKKTIRQTAHKYSRDEIFQLDYKLI